MTTPYETICAELGLPGRHTITGEGALAKWRVTGGVHVIAGPSSTTATLWTASAASAVYVRVRDGT